MNKRILLGSIIVVTTLILVTFSGVVGYQTTKSNTITRTSPLFNMRINRAIGEESKDIACDYVGKGEESILSIPTRLDRTTSLQKIQRLIDLIYKMDDKTFNKLIGLVINRIKNNGHTDITKVEIVNTLNQLRKNQETDTIPFVNMDNSKFYTEDMINSCTFSNYKYGCFVFRLIWLIAIILDQIGFLILVLMMLIPTFCLGTGPCTTI